MFDGNFAREGRGLVMTPRGEREDRRSAGASGDERQEAHKKGKGGRR